MSKVYEIEIEETLQHVYQIKANSLDEAISIAQEKYSEEEFVLDENDFKGVEFREYKDELINNKQRHKKDLER